MANVVEALVPGGKASAGPPLGPALGPLGVNVAQVVAKINEQTKDLNGMQVPVKIIVKSRTEFEVEVGTPPTSALIIKEMGVEKGTGDNT
ncbi:MAG: 50S ribosomal protein L11, partial [Methanothrix sp.]